MSKSREQLNNYLKNIKIGGKTVLDVGVQDKPTSRLTEGEPAGYYTTDIDHQWESDFIFDLNEPIENLEQVKAPRLWEEKAIPDEFDIIFCIEVLEHCWNPVQAIKTLSSLLKKGGRIYISTPFINPHHDYVDYLRYTNEWYRDVLPKFGLKVNRIEERNATTGKQWLQMFFDTEGLKISKIRKEYGNYTYPIGYFVVAVKQ